MLESGKGIDLSFKNEEKPSHFDIIYKKLKEFIFEVQFLVLRYQTSSSIWIELFSNCVVLLQFLTFSFHQAVRTLYYIIVSKNSKTKKIISCNTSFFQFFFSYRIYNWKFKNLFHYDIFDNYNYNFKYHIKNIYNS